MTRSINMASIAARMFHTPLMIDPIKGGVIASAFGPRVLGVESVDLVDPALMPGNLPNMRDRGPMLSLLGDGLTQRLKERKAGFERVGNVAVIPITGTLVRRGAFLGESSGQTSYEGLNAQIQAAASDPSIHAIAFEIDTGGGEAAGCFELCVNMAKARQVKPLFAFLADNALSAGYAIASQCDHITCPEFGQAGSIGVIMLHFDYSDHAKKAGVKITVIRAGEEKARGNMFEPLPKEMLAAWQGIGDKMRIKFATVVTAGRGDRLSFKAAMKTEAAAFDGAEARKLGLVDQVADPKVAFDEMVENVAEGGTWRAPGRTGLSTTTIDAAALAAGNLAAVDAAAIDALTVQVAAAGAVTAGAVENPAAPLLPVLAEIAQSVSDELAEFKKFAPDLAQSIAGDDASKNRGPGRITQEGEDMSKTNDKKPRGDQVQAADTITRVADTITGGDAGATTEAAADATTRATTISGAVAKAGLPAQLAADLIGDADLSVEGALAKIIDAKADAVEDGGDINGGSSIRITGDGVERMQTGMANALFDRANMEGGENNEFTGLSLKEMARHTLIARGVNVSGMRGLTMVGAAFTPSLAGGSHSTSDFGNVLANVANKAMLQGFQDADETFEAWTRAGSLGDFKAATRVGMDLFPSLRKVAPGAEFKLATVGDRGETIVLLTYGERFSINRQAIINDDLDAFTKIPNMQGRAAKATVGDLAYAVLTGAHVMGDGTALFHADHSNLAGSGAAPSEAAVNAGIDAMATQTDRAGNRALNIRAAYILAGYAQRSTVLQTLNSEYAPDDTSKAGTAKMQRAHNTAYKAATPIFDARITGNQWFLAADPNATDTVEIAYLDGVTEPFLDQQDGWSVDGTEYKVRIDVGAKATGWEGLYKDPGQ